MFPLATSGFRDVATGAPDSSAAANANRNIISVVAWVLGLKSLSRMCFAGDQRMPFGERILHSTAVALVLVDHETLENERDFDFRFSH